MRHSRISLFVALLTVATGAIAQKAPHYPIEQFKLKNGMRVVLSEDHSAPLVGLDIGYDVGSRNEVKGRTGFAHLFEHLMFTGSAHVARGQFDRLIEGSGGSSNGFTQDESTNYIESFPSEKLPMVLWIEADRMRSLAVNAENLKNQQEVVKEEKRLNYDNQPYVNARTTRLQELAYTNFTNKHTTIGSMADVDAASLADVQSFFKTYYAPNNAVLVLVGDFNAKQARALIERYFGEIPAQAAPPKPDTTESQQTTEKRDMVNDPLARVPALAIAWHGPSLGNPDSYAMDLLNEILFGGETSRGYQALVKGKQIALQIQGNLDAQRGPSLYTLFALYRPNVSAKEMEKSISDQIDLLKLAAPSESELSRVKTRFRASRYRAFSIFGLESMLGRAIQIAMYTLSQNDPNLVNTEINRYMAVTPEQIQAVAKKYFTPENRTVVEIKPAAAAGVPNQGGTKP